MSARDEKKNLLLIFRQARRRTCM